MSVIRLGVSATGGTGPGTLLPAQPARSQTLSRMTVPRSRRYPLFRISPSRMVALRLRAKTAILRYSYSHAFLYAANQRADRLPLLMLQTWMTRQKIRDEPRVFKALRAVSSQEWTDRFHGLAARGWSRDDIDHWIWVLSGEDGDVRVARLISTDTPKPIFLTLLLVRSDEWFRKPESILSLMEYVARRHFRYGSGPSGDRIADLTSKTVMTASQFLILLRRVVHHILRKLPRSIITVARLVVDFIRRLPNDEPRSYHRQCMVFNTALLLFSRPAATRPILNREFNWRAQKVLLAMSDNFPRPLIISQAGYRAVREVMIGLKKSKTEKAVAVRYAKSWPPHRQDFDGLDARRTPEDDYSRSVKAGLLMKAAGYTETHYDAALGALGGMDGSSPTIQTLSLPPKKWTGKGEGLNLYTRWAMMVRATRNAQEAWAVFNQVAADAKEAPNTQVYAEMFIKLVARPLPSDSAALPGDSREVLPVHDENYSDYELARLSPPTVDELYQQMLSHGVRPKHHCLQVLVGSASSLEEAARYLEDSGMDPAVISALATYKESSYGLLRQVTLLTFTSFIRLLCRLHPNRQGRARIDPEGLLFIRHAIRITSLRLRADTTEGSTFQPPWCIIMRALARPHICVKNGTPSENNDEALDLCLDVLGSVQSRVGVDPEIFLYFCRVVQKAAYSRLCHVLSSKKPEVINAATPLMHSAEEVSKHLTKIFSRLTTCIKTYDTELESVDAPLFMQNIGPAHLHAYMRALAFLEDTSAMKKLLEWMLENQEYINQEAERIGRRGFALIARTLCAFHAFAGPILGEDELEKMIPLRKDPAQTGSWRWPRPREVEIYIKTDGNRSSVRLQLRVLARAQHSSSPQESQEVIERE
ncbi:hypothetical protein GGS23DRAFT_523014 [Durotheca rogersii]|uniref:uncharacterized protein n=1 Tax=Durotheca rogersii TaxID=419775 RepID=UPI00222069DB|nr:uncharacterized protein GGS23DRAFT_523014 [Durotheca rogersii]KAI5863962.1 hypothetical protein GGS23DRAFT_523014 [Durotheca rogersii]